jgi:hypothetical protein
MREELKVMTTVEAVAEIQAAPRPASGRTDEVATVKPIVSPSTSEHLVDCPACGLPATIESRDMVAGTSGPEVHVQLRCPVGRHWFVLSEEGL